jgi:hypothetical protein
MQTRSEALNFYLCFFSPTGGGEGYSSAHNGSVRRSVFLKDISVG